MVDTGVKGRVIGLLAGTTPIKETPEQTDVRANSTSDTDAQQQALQVLTLAQRTAEDHVADAHRQAEEICTEARVTAQQIVRDAETRASDLRWQADKALTEARAAAEKMGREARKNTEEMRHSADKILADARAKADEIADDAHAKADEMKQQAQQRYEDVVGSLAGKRAALQEQIEALEVFDREYRNRIGTFLQSQLRALWLNQPQVDGELESAEQPPDQSDTKPEKKK